MVKGCSYTQRDLCCIRTSFSPDGQFFAVRWKKYCRVYTTSDQGLFAEFDADERLYSIDFSPCGKFMALGTDDMVKVIEF